MTRFTVGLVTFVLFVLQARGVEITEFVTTTDDVQDYGPIIQAAVDSLVDDDGRWPDTSGGAIHFSRGRYPMLTGVTIPCAGVILIGEGNPFSYACTLEWQCEDEDAAMFTFISEKDKSRRSYGFAMRDFKLRGKRQGTAFRFAAHDRYVRDFVFTRIGVNYFRTVFEARGGEARSWGALCCNNCTFSYNGQVVTADETSGGAFNEWRFRDCCISKNGLKQEGWPAAYAMSFLAGSNGLLDGCVLEHQPRALKVRSMQGLRVEGCRFEGNTSADESDPVVLIENSTGVWFRANFHRVLRREEGPDVPPTILFRDCLDYHVDRMLGKVRIERGWEGRF